MASLNVTVQTGLTTRITYTTAERPGGGDRTVVVSGFNNTQRLNSSTTPAVTKEYNNTLTGSQTLDFTALTSPYTGSVDASGLKLQGLIVNNPAANATAVTIAEGASNGYQIMAGQSLVIPPGGRCAIFFDDELPDVAAADAEIDITAGAGESYDIGLVFG